MKLLSIDKGNKQSLGVKTDTGIVDVERALSLYPAENVATTVMEVIENGPEGVMQLAEFMTHLPDQDDRIVIDPNGLAWGPAVPEPNKIICIGLNYRKHADETKMPYPDQPILFSKFNNALTGHQHHITIPSVTKKLDFEAELTIVIGQEAQNVSEGNALDYVFGYTIANDLSARDLQFSSSQWLIGKTSDGFCPIGPYVVTKDEIADPNQLNVKTYVNGEERQNSNTSDMIFSCKEIVSYISKYMTLSPGDIILTGSPEGVILGDPEEEQIFLQPGDVVTIEIEKLGRLTNEFV